MLSIISNGLGGLLKRKRAFDYIKHHLTDKPKIFIMEDEDSVVVMKFAYESSISLPTY